MRNANSKYRLLQRLPQTFHCEFREQYFWSSQQIKFDKLFLLIHHLCHRASCTIIKQQVCNQHILNRRSNRKVSVSNQNMHTYIGSCMPVCVSESMYMLVRARRNICVCACVNRCTQVYVYILASTWYVIQAQYHRDVPGSEKSSL